MIVGMFICLSVCVCNNFKSNEQIFMNYLCDSALTRGRSGHILGNVQLVFCVQNKSEFSKVQFSATGILVMTSKVTSQSSLFLCF